MNKTIDEIEKLVSAIGDARNEIDNSLLDVDFKINDIKEAECKMYSAIYALRKASQEWHPASDQPIEKDGWFLALTKDNLPFLTHYVDGWLPQVYMWQYINIPTHTL